MNSDGRADELLGLFVPGPPVDGYSGVDPGFRDPAGNGWKMIQAAAS